MFDVSWFRQKEDPWHGLALARLSVYIICLAVVSLACVHHCPCLGERDLIRAISDRIRLIGEVNLSPLSVELGAPLVR